MRRLAFLLLAILLLLSACDYQISSPARTEVPIFLAPPVNTPTSPPTPTPDYASWIEMGDEVIINEEAYAFRPILRITPDGPHFTVSLLSNELGTQFTSIHEENTHLLFSIWSENQRSLI